MVLRSYVAFLEKKNFFFEFRSRAIQVQQLVPFFNFFFNSRN